MKNDYSLELKTERMKSLFAISIIISILFAGLLYFAIINRSIYFYTSMPFVILLGLWLVVYFPYQIYLQTTSEADTIIFDTKTITIRNKKFDIFETFDWSTVKEVIITKKDYDQKPEEVTLISTEIVRTINLKLYDTIFTTTEEIYKKIMTIYETSKQN